MKIAVCVKYVPDATGDRHFEDDKTVDLSVVGRPPRPRVGASANDGTVTASL